MASSAAAAKQTLYFGYGSNLWKIQMLQRCPESKYLGIARLDGYRWIISERGYANVVQISPPGLSRKDNHVARERSNGGDDQDHDVVWGLVYALSASDEKKLDRNEGVPVAYTKENLSVDFWPADSSNSSSVDKPDIRAPPEKVDMLVYIDRQRIRPDKPKREYVYRMNMGIEDAIGEGMPEGYVRGVLRGSIPEGSDEGDGDGDGDGEEVRVLAAKQAREFVEE